MQRITEKDIDTVLNLVNNSCTHKDYRLALGHAYGKIQVYLVDKEEYKNGGTMKQHITSGTKREIFDYLHAMKNVFWYLV
jgi:hypothetical protein